MSSFLSEDLGTLFSSKQPDRVCSQAVLVEADSSSSSTPSPVAAPVAALSKREKQPRLPAGMCPLRKKQCCYCTLIQNSCKMWFLSNDEDTESCSLDSVRCRTGNVKRSTLTPKLPEPWVAEQHPKVWVL